MNMKGQGALEYLLLIGGAIVVAVIVVTLLLGVGSSSGDQTEISSAASLCTQDAAINTTTGPANCANVDGAGGSIDRNVTISGTMYMCGGTYPSCTAEAA